MTYLSNLPLFTAATRGVSEYVCGFEVDDDSRLRVDTEEFLRTREAIARVERGEGKSTVAKDTGVPVSTLSGLHEERAGLFLAGEGDELDGRVDAAVEELRPLDELRGESAEDLDERIRSVVREELEAATDE
ncbi:hypothetical protein [Halorubrum sp. DTA98]|uniref:hypothetical protein n=1 Tax=Halorubrum sp. DTA98 TaxID=3402163 RepID=UPI003AB0FDB0